MDEEINRTEQLKRGHQAAIILFDGLAAYDVEFDKINLELRRKTNELCLSLANLPNRTIPTDDNFRRRMDELWQIAVTKNFSAERDEKLATVKKYIAEVMPFELPPEKQQEIETLIDTIAEEEDLKRKERDDYLKS